jgi:N-methylhydantoinase A
MLRIAFDIGGTFTDLVLHDTQRGTMRLHKVPSTPEALELGVMRGLDALLGQSGAGETVLQVSEITSVLHATTVATNAILQRSGAPTAVITTRGFRDVLLIGRQKRYDTYDLYLEKPAPLAQRRNIFEIEERIDASGEMVQAINLDSVDQAIDAIQAAGLCSVAVALIHAYANSAHEQAVAERIAERAPQLAISLSSQVSPKIREYERINTTVANAYVAPLVDHYLGQLETATQRRGLPSNLSVMQSNGGLASVALARRYPVRIVESGPAAGVMLCAAVGRQAGFNQLLTFDMGGTTAKLGAVDDGEPVVTPTFEVDNRHFRKFSGLPLNVPAVELLEIGAGGGSIASVDMGLIRVGPTSAGASPGPMCYGLGGARPTVTDANLVLGYLNPAFFNGGAMALDRQAARAGIERDIAEPLGISPGEAAWGIHAIANANMESAMRVVSIERGRDPRKYTMVAFGGAGPVHAARLARGLGIPRVIVPQGAGVGSAIGLLHARPRIDLSVTRILPLPRDNHAELAAVYEELTQRVNAELLEMGRDGAPRLTRYAYLRHVGQGFEIKVDLPPGNIDGDYMEQSREAFFASYARRFGYRDEDTEIEGIDWQLAATYSDEHSEPGGLLHDSAGDDAPPPLPEASVRTAYFPELGGYAECQIIDRYRMPVNTPVQGPAIVEERECTTVISPGDCVQLTGDGHLLIDIGEN